MRRIILLDGEMTLGSGWEGGNDDEIVTSLAQNVRCSILCQLREFLCKII
jgi:hypothetical protein